MPENESRARRGPLTAGMGESQLEKLQLLCPSANELAQQETGEMQFLQSPGIRRHNGCLFGFLLLLLCSEQRSVRKKRDASGGRAADKGAATSLPQGTAVQDHGRAAGSCPGANGREKRRTRLC